MSLKIEPVRTASDLAATRGLFREYVDWLGIDLAFQGFEDELATLPGKYEPPRGDLFLAKRDDGYPVGCVGLRPFDGLGACEVKRLYVRELARGTGAGRALATAAITFAAAAGYREALLDTLPAMPSAIRLYRSLGFEEIPPYWNNIVPGVLYFGKRL